MIGIVNLKKVALVSGKMVGITAKLIGKKGNPWGLIPVAAELLAVAQSLVGVDFSLLPSEIKDLDIAERQEIAMALFEGLKA